MDTIMDATLRLLEHDPMAQYRRESEAKAKRDAECVKSIRFDSAEMIRAATDVLCWPTIARTELLRLKAALARIEANLDIIDPAEPLPEDDEQLREKERADQRERDDWARSDPHG